METWIQTCLHQVQWTLPAHWKQGYLKIKVMQHQGCSTQTTSRIVEH